MKTKIAIRLIFWTVIIISMPMLFLGCADTLPPGVSKQDLRGGAFDSAQLQKSDVPPPAAKSGPSFEETRDWIVNTLEQYGGVSGGDSWDNYAHVAISNSGRLTYTHYKYLLLIDSGRSPYSIERVTIPLGSVTDVGYTTDGANLIVVDVETGQTAAITYQIIAGSGNKSSNDEFFHMYRTPEAKAGQPMPTSPDQIRTRFVTALKHMVDICKDAYSAPTQTQTTQPF